MATELYSAAGSQMFIGGVLATKKADFVSGDFTSQTYVEVDGWETFGTIGDASEALKTALINRGRVIKQKGPRDAGSMENTFAVIDGDAGQDDVEAAEGSQDNYAFKIVWSSGEIWQFIALVMSKTMNGGDASAVLKKTYLFEINSNIVET